MGRLADLKAKCSGGVGATCTAAEFAEFQNLSHENSATSWFDRIMGGFNSISGVVLSATGQQPAAGAGSYAAPAQSKPVSPLVWVGAVVGGVILIVVIILVARRKPAK